MPEFGTCGSVGGPGGKPPGSTRRRHLWGRGYFVASTGNVSEEMIAQYIENQQDPERDHDADFKVHP